MENGQYGEEIDHLNLGRYGLSHLAGRNVLALEPPEMDQLLLALGDDGIALNVPIACTADNVRDLLAVSECRRCGRCCQPDPLNPASPGIEVFEDELGALAAHLHLPYEDIRKKTGPGHAAPYAFQVVKLGLTRWLPLPCPFYRAEPGGCQAYEVRPIVCRVYPVIFTGDDTYTSIRAGCDYGRDIIKAACARLRASEPNREIRL